MIGFFDSGLGGLTILKEVEKILPEYSYIYLGDNARTPYGSLSQEIIFEYTKEGVEELFRKGAQLVILACNTASAVSLRKIQQEWLPRYYPEKRVLGIFVPTVEEISNYDRSVVGLFATQATVESGAFIREITKNNPQAIIEQHACPLLVPMIEMGEMEQLEGVVEKYVQELFLKNNKIDTVLLGCTHYAIIEDIFRKYVSADMRIISQGQIVAKSLKNYLERHVEIANMLKVNGGRVFLTTESSLRVKQLARMFYDKNVDFKVAKI